MKKILLTFVAALTLFSCTSNDESAASENQDQEITVTELTNSEGEATDATNALLKLFTSGNDLTQDETDYINSKIQEIKSETSGSGYRKITISYPSVDAQGNSVNLSGAIYMSKEPETFNEILLYCHQTGVSNNDVPCGTGALCLEPMAVSSSNTTVCFASDYLGFNTSKQYTHPYMNNALAARNELDMLKAGLVYLKNKGYEMETADTGLKTYIVGYSQGGGVNLATVKALEADTELSKKVNFVGSFCGAGPYNLRTTFNKFLEDKKMDLPLVLPYVLIGMYESYPDLFEGIDIYRYLSDKSKEVGLVEYIKNKPDLLSTSTWISKNVGDSISQIMSVEAQDLNSEIMQKLFTALDKQNLLDGSWEPTHPILFYHSNQDNIVSYGNTTEALSLFQSTNMCSLSTHALNVGHVMEYMNYAVRVIVNRDYRVDK